MKKTFKKFTAFAMVAVMMANPMSALAATGTSEITSPASGNATGSGELEGYLTEDDQIFSVTLPTDDSDAPTFAFTMDPQNLLKETDPTNYTTSDTVLFSTKSGTSNELSIVNNSQFDVDVSLTATMTGLSGKDYAISMATDNTFKNASGNAITDPSLYLGLVYETASANGVSAVASKTVAVTTTGIKEKVTLGGMPNNYEIKKTSSGYEYAKKASGNAPATGIAKFKMTGACNPNADWSAIDDAETPAAPTVTIVWSVEKHSEDVDCTFSASSEVGVINYTKGAGTGELDKITSIVMVNNGKPYDGYNANAQYGWKAAVVGDSTITIDSTYINYYAADTDAVITYTTKGNATPKTATVKVKVK